MGALLAGPKTCVCGDGVHPQEPAKPGTQNFHKCGTCGNQWAYGHAAPVCLGEPVVVEAAS